MKSLLKVSVILVLFLSCAVSFNSQESDQFFFDEKNEQVLTQFLTSAKGQTRELEEEQMLLITITVDQLDTLVSMALIPYPSMIRIDDERIEHRMFYHKGYSVSVYDNSGGGVSHRIIIKRQKDSLKKRLKKDMLHNKSKDNLKGYFQLYSIHEGCLVKRDYSPESSFEQEM